MTLKKLTASIWGVGIGLTVATALSLVFTSTSFLSGVLVAVWVLVVGILIIYTVMKKKADFCGCKVSHSGQYSGSNESSLWGYCHIAGKSGEFRIAFGVFCLYEAFAPDGL